MTILLEANTVVLAQCQECDWMAVAKTNNEVQKECRKHGHSVRIQWVAKETLQYLEIN